MIDVHVPHKSDHTWTDFFIHIATIVVGLLLAIGLEQTVEFIHHHHQVRDTREALRVERESDIRRFALQTEELHRSTAMYIEDSTILDFLRNHSRAAAAQWPGHLSFAGIIITYSDSAWKTAQQSGVLAYMPRDEVRQLDELYDRLDKLNSASEAIREAVYQARALYLNAADPAQLTPVQFDTAIDHVNQARVRVALVAQLQRNLAARYSDFAPAPTAGDVAALLQSPPTSSGTSTDLWQQLMDKWNAIDSQQNIAAP